MTFVSTEISRVRLGSICELINGRAFKPTDWTDTGLPIVRIQNLNNPEAQFNLFDGEVRPRFLIDTGALLFAWSGTPGTSFGTHIWNGGPAVLNQHIFHMRFDEKLIDKQFLRLAMTQKLDELISKAHGGVGLRHVTKGVVEATEIALPSLAGQRRIVDLLLRAEGIVRLRAEAESKAQKLVPALFLEMFGNPASNPKRWPVRRVRDVVASFEGGRNLQPGSNNGSAYRILKVSAVTKGTYKESESKPAPNGYVPPESHVVRTGDLLFSRANTEALVGATALVDATDGRTLLPDKLWRFVWAEPAESLYYYALFQSSYVRRQLGKLSTGTSASMRNVSQGKLFSMELPIAPIEHQKRFAELVAEVRSIQSQQERALARANATFKALLVHCFGSGLN
jgi:type I restriction enzyme S subunit